MLPPFRKVRVNDSGLTKVQDSLATVFGAVLAKEIIDGNLLENVALVSGSTNLVEHKLGKPVSGYIVVKRNSNQAVWDSEGSNTKKNNYLQLEASGSVTVSLWVF